MIKRTLSHIINPDQAISRPKGNGVIHVKTTNQYYYPSHKTPYMLATQLNGKGNYRLNGRPIEISERYFYFLNENDELEIRFNEKATVETLLVLFDNDFIHDCESCIQSSTVGLLDDPFDKTNRLTTIPEVPFVLNGQLRLLLSNLTDPALTQEVLDDCLYELIIAFDSIEKTTRGELRKIDVVKKSTQQELYRRLFLAKEYLHDHVNSSVSLDSLASAVGMNKFHLLANFKNLFDDTPHQYLVKLKLEKAKKMLRSKKYNVTQTCYALGFTSLGSFSHSFARYFGKTPASILK
ncbi:MAG: AraC family transcriptional regulator [Reichenbachiella sp.]|uniref:helix-turn-helix domain-containing protein n=1 Tax=Reichenbachiella sp. TaxID=2184521 RepID=UPI0032631BE7